MKYSVVSFACVLAVAAVACSSTTTHTPTPSDADAGEHVMHEDSGASEVDSGVEASSSKPATPAVVSVEPLAGGLHVTWKLNGTGLTGVELWRKKDAGTYAKAFSLPGSATSQHDEGASAPGTFCYQVMTIRGSEMSEMSAEKCGTP